MRSEVRISSKDFAARRPLFGALAGLLVLLAAPAVAQPAPPPAEPVPPTPPEVKPAPEAAPEPAAAPPPATAEPPESAEQAEALEDVDPDAPPPRQGVPPGRHGPRRGPQGAWDDDDCEDAEADRAFCPHDEGLPPGAARGRGAHGRMRLPPHRAGHVQQMLGLHHGPFHLQPHTLVQLQAGLLTGDDNLQPRDRFENEGFAMRRARFGVHGGLGRRVAFSIETDLVDPDDPLNEAWVSIDAWRHAKAVFGSHKVPFARSALLGSGQQALIERSFAVNAMAPFRQVGVSLQGEYDLLGLSWHLGAFNGFERDVNFHAGIRENAGLRGNRFGGLSYVARLQLEPLGKMGKAVADLCPRDLRVAVGGGVLQNDAGATTSTSVSADVHVKMRGFHLLAEYLRDTASPEDVPTTPSTIPAELTREAVVAELGYAWWRFNVAARFELIDPNTDTEDDADQQVHSFAVGYQMLRNRLRLQLQYDHATEGGGFDDTIENQTLFGQVQLML